MRIWLQNFVSSQPRTSLEKSDVPWSTASAQPSPQPSAGRDRGPGHEHGLHERERRRGLLRGLEAKYAAAGQPTFELVLGRRAR